MDTKESVKRGLFERHPYSLDVLTELGTIDLLTMDTIFVVSSVHQWKAAIGEAIVFGKLYPNHKKVVHLFGNFHPDFRSKVFGVCRDLGIVVSWESGANWPNYGG